MDDASEGIMENPIPELEDLELECAVSLEAAYNDVMLEMCQLKYQSLVEGVAVIHEGVIESIKNFFKKLFSVINKFFGGTNNDTNTASQGLDNLKKKSNDNRVAAGVRWMLKHPEISEKYKLIGYDTLFIGDIDFDSSICAAGNYGIDRIKNDSNPDGDKIALDVLHTFIKSAFKGTGKINVNQINSLADYKKALYSHVQFVPMNEIFGNDYNKSDRGVQMGIDKMKSKIPNAIKYKKMIERHMHAYENEIIKVVENEHSNRLSIACKIIKTISQACMITISYGQWLNGETLHRFSRVFNAAAAVNAKDE